MEKKDFYALLKNQEDLKNLSIDSLNDLIRQYPWFSSAHLLKAKKAQQQNNPELETILSSAATYANNRQALFDLMYPRTTEKIIFSEPIAENGNGKSVSPPEIKREEEIKIPIAEKIIPVQEIVAEKKAEANQEEKISEEELEIINQSSAAGEFAQNNLDEESDEPEMELMESELASTVSLENEIEESETDEQMKDAEVELLSNSEFAHKNEEDPEEEGVADEHLNPEVEALQMLEAVEFTDAPVSKTESTPTINTEEENSFLDWLKLFSGKEISQEPSEKIIPPQTEPKKQEAKDETETLIEYTGDFITTKSDDDLIAIDNFVKSQRVKKENPVSSSITERAENSVLDDDFFATETLADILIAQGKPEKAISVFEKLSLKLPSKSHYFAARIKELKTKL